MSKDKYTKYSVAFKDGAVGPILKEGTVACASNLGLRILLQNN